MNFSEAAPPLIRRIYPLIKRIQMAGKPGRSGGARPGAGRPRTKPEESTVPVPQGDVDMLQLLQNVALGLTEATPLQVRAAIAAVQYTHTKRADGGKKEEAADKANKAAGKFTPTQPPRLVVSNGAR